MLLNALLLLSSLTTTAHAAPDCGLRGSITARVQDCREARRLEQGGWSLVTRNQGFEVWRDDASGLIWGDLQAPAGARGNATQLHYGHAESTCSAEADAPRGGLKQVYWRLPTQEDFSMSQKNGLLEVLPNFRICDDRGHGCDFWTSTESRNELNRVTFNGEDGRFGYKSIWTYFSAVRCVGRQVR